MKKLSLKPVLLIAITALSIVACQKTTDNGIANPDYEQIKKLFKEAGPKFENFTIDAGTGGVVVTTRGTKYTFPANGLVDENGNVVTGSVTVAIKEILGVSDMILGDKPTITDDGQMLISYGEFFIKAMQNNKNLNLKEDSVVGVQVPGKPNGRQEIPMWDGDTTITTVTNGYNHLNQPVSITETFKVSKGVEWSQNGSYAFFNGTNGTIDFSISDLMTWVNCDALSGDPGPKTTVLGYFSNYYNNQTGNNFSGEQPTMLYFKPQGRNTLIKLYNVIMNAPAGKEGLHSYQSSMPVGLAGTYLAISTVNGKFYAEMKDAVVGAPVGTDDYSTVTFTLEEVTATALLNLINQMNSK